MRFKLPILLMAGVALEFVLPKLFWNSSSLLDDAASWATVITGVAAIVALAAFLYQRSRDNSLSAIDQIRLYRTEVLPAHEKYTDAVRAVDPGYLYPAKRIQNFSPQGWRLENPDIFSQQKELLEKNTLDNNIIKYQTELLNCLEEFSLRVLESDNASQGVLSSVHFGFISLVEQNISGLDNCYIQLGTTFPGLTDLYIKWRDRMDRRMPIDRFRYVSNPISKDLKTTYLDLP